MSVPLPKPDNDTQHKAKKAFRTSILYNEIANFKTEG